MELPPVSPEQWAKTRRKYAEGIHVEEFVRSLTELGWTADMLAELDTEVRRRSTGDVVRLPIAELLFEVALQVRARRGYGEAA